MDTLPVELVTCILDHTCGYAVPAVCTQWRHIALAMPQYRAVRDMYAIVCTPCDTYDLQQALKSMCEPFPKSKLMAFHRREHIYTCDVRRNHVRILAREMISICISDGNICVKCRAYQHEYMLSADSDDFTCMCCGIALPTDRRDVIGVIGVLRRHFRTDAWRRLYGNLSGARFLAALPTTRD